jgi:hypothetical protein
LDGLDQTLHGTITAGNYTPSPTTTNYFNGLFVSIKGEGRGGEVGEGFLRGGDEIKHPSLC